MNCCSKTDTKKHFANASFFIQYQLVMMPGLYHIRVPQITSPYFYSCTLAAVSKANQAVLISLFFQVETPIYRYLGILKMLSFFQLDSTYTVSCCKRASVDLPFFAVIGQVHTQVNYKQIEIMMLGNSFYSNDESTRNLYINIGKNFILFYALEQYLRKFICIIIKSLILVLYLPILLTLCNFSKKFLPPPQKNETTIWQEWYNIPPSISSIMLQTSGKG